MSLEQFRSFEAGLNVVAAQSNKDTPKKVPKTFSEKVKFAFRNITVEPVLLCYTFPSVMSSIAMQNLNLDKACRVNLGLNGSICDALEARNTSGYGVQDEQDVQILVSEMNTYKNVFQSVLPSLVLLFVGSWSDYHKLQKPCILMALIGDAASTVCFLISTFFFYQLPLEFNCFAESVPQGLSGGWFVMSMAVYSYISNITDTETRTFRIGIVQITWNLFYIMGTAFSGVLLQKIGYYGIFSLALVLYTAAILYTCFFIKEYEDGKFSLNKVYDIFHFKHAKSTLNVLYKKGPKNRRLRISLIMILVMIIIGPMHGEYNVMYMFMRYKFGWNEVEFSLFQTFMFIINTGGNVFYLAMFSKVFKLDDSVMGIMSSLSKCASSVVYGFAPDLKIFCVGVFVESLNGVSFIALRSMMSKLVSGEELGKLSSIFALSEALMPLIYGPLYNRFYSKTIDTFPGAFFILGGVLTIPSVFMLVWFYFQHKKDEKEESAPKEQKEKFLDKNIEEIELKD